MRRSFSQRRRSSSVIFITPEEPSGTRQTMCCTDYHDTDTEAWVQSLVHALLQIALPWPRRWTRLRSEGGLILPLRFPAIRAPVCALRSHRPKPAFRKVILDGDRRSDGRYLEISCRGQHRSLWQTTRRWPSPRRPLHRPRPCPRTDWGLAATPHSEPDLTPRTSLRAEQRACAPLFQGTSFPHLKWIRLPIKNGSEFSIGPTRLIPPASAGDRSRRGRASAAPHATTRQGTGIQPQASSGPHRAASQKPGALIAPDNGSWPKHCVTMS